MSNQRNYDSENSLFGDLKNTLLNGENSFHESILEKNKVAYQQNS